MEVARIRIMFFGELHVVPPFMETATFRLVFRRKREQRYHLRAHFKHDSNMKPNDTTRYLSG